jgi:hypothetical protein
VFVKYFKHHYLCTSNVTATCFGRTWATIKQHLLLGGHHCTVHFVLSTPRHIVVVVANLRLSKVTFYFSIISMEVRPPLWSSCQRSWLQIQRSRVRFLALTDFLEVLGLVINATVSCIGHCNVRDKQFCAHLSYVPNSQNNNINNIAKISLQGGGCFVESNKQIKCWEELLACLPLLGHEEYRKRKKNCASIQTVTCSQMHPFTFYPIARQTDKQQGHLTSPLLSFTK